MLTTRNRVWEHEGQLGNREDWLKTMELGWHGQAICSMSNAALNHKWAELLMGQFG
jgi:hypothetical protein